jgi:hypothetical protein
MDGCKPTYFKHVRVGHLDACHIHVGRSLLVNTKAIATIEDVNTVASDLIERNVIVDQQLFSLSTQMNQLRTALGLLENLLPRVEMLEAQLLETSSIVNTAFNITT